MEAINIGLHDIGDLVSLNSFINLREISLDFR